MKIKQLIVAAALLMGTFVHAANYTQTKNPIVLVHGLLGWDAAIDAIRSHLASLYTEYDC